MGKYYSSNNALKDQYLVDLFDEDKKSESEQIDVQEGIKTSGSSIYDFLGQAAWGTTEAASFSTLGAADIYHKAKGQSTYEEAITESLGGVAGEWHELTGAGRAGFITGQAIGMLPTFGAGKAISEFGVKTVAKIGGVGLKTAKKQSQKELKEQIVSQSLDKKLKTKTASELMDDTVQKNIIDDSYDAIELATTAFRRDRNLVSAEIINKTAAKTIKSSLKNTLNITDDAALDPIAKELFDIVSKNNPYDAQKLLFVAGRRIADYIPFARPGLKEGAGFLVGAAAYDATIGLAMGTMRAAAHQLQKNIWGVEYAKDPITGDTDYHADRVYTGDHSYNFGEHMGNWMHHSLSEAFHFAFIGPVKYLPGFKFFGQGSTNQPHLRNLGQIMYRSTRAYWKPIKKYTRDELKIQLEAMNQISGGNLVKSNFGKKVGDKFAVLGDKFWHNNETKTKTMQEFLGVVRKDFVKNAPVEWTKQFGADVINSLPRMAAGVVAMNGPGVVTSMNKYGWSLENLKTSLGDKPEEISANIFTAMFFTRRPHKYHTRMDNKFFGKIVNTSEVPEYYAFQKNKYQKIMGGLQTFGRSDVNDLNRVIMQYDSEWRTKSTVNKAIEDQFNRVIDETPEFKDVKQIFSKYENAPGGSTLEQAFHKGISELYGSGKLSLDKINVYEKQLSVAKKVLDAFNKNSSKDIDNQLYTPETAMEIVENLSAMRWGGKNLPKDALAAETLIKDWAESKLGDAIQHPQLIAQNYVDRTLEALGLDHTKSEDAMGNLQIPKLSLSGSGLSNDLISELKYNITMGKKNGWLVEGPTTERVRVSGETIAKVEQVRKSSQAEMMEFMEPDYQSRGIDLDNNILVTHITGITYSQYANKARDIQVYNLLTGGKDHKFNIHESDKMLNLINDYMKFRKAPDIDAKDAKEGFGDHQTLIENLHSVVSFLNPSESRKGKYPKDLTATEAKEIYESVQSLTGDLFTNSQFTADFKTYALGKAIDRLGIDNVAIGVDLRASLATLAHDISINNGTETRMVLPEWLLMRGKLDAAKENKLITEKSYDEISEYYENLYKGLVKSNFPVKFRDNIVEDNPGDWVNALRNSLTAGKISMDKFASDKADALSSIVTGELARVDRFAELIKLGQTAQSGKGIKDAEKLLIELTKVKENLQTYQKDLTEAVQTQNPYTLRALGKMDVQLKDLITRMSSKVDKSNMKDYYEELASIHEAIIDKAQSYSFSEVDMKDFLIQEMKRFSLPTKDIQDKIIKISTNQFMSRYKFSSKDMESIFDFANKRQADKDDVKQYLDDFLTKMYNPDSKMKQILKDNPSLANEINNIKSTYTTFADKLGFDTNTPEGRSNFENFIIKPLKLKMKFSLADFKGELPEPGVIDADIYSVLSNLYGKRTVKRLEVYQKDGANKLYQDEASVSNVVDRAFGGLIDHIDPAQHNIYLGSSGGVDRKGNVISDITDRGLMDINISLDKGGYEIEHKKGKSNFLRLEDSGALHSPNRQKADLSARYWTVPLNESTHIIIRTDNYAQGLHKQIGRSFRGEDLNSNDQGGLLFKKLKEVYRNDLSDKNVSKVLDQVQNPKTRDDLILGIKLARTLIDFPLEVEAAIRANDFDLINQIDIAKRLKMAEPKGSFVPTPENLAKSKIVMESSESDFYKKSYNMDILDNNGNKTGTMKDWFEPGKKIKVGSIDDSGVVKDAQGKPLFNIFDSFERAKRNIAKKYSDGLIDKTTRDLENKIVEEGKKSIVDAEFFSTFDLQLASMMYTGLHPDMVYMDQRGNITGFKSGAVKPVITHANIDLNNGLIEQVYIKTAMKYDPEIAKIIKSYGLDALTFKSANKQNKIQERGSDTRDRFSKLTETSATESNLELPWHDVIRNNNNINMETFEIPVSSLSLRSIAKGEKDPSVGQNAQVHMDHNTGVSEWVGLDAKLTKYNHSIENIHKDILERTAIAKRVLGEGAKGGDPAMVNSVMSNVLLRDGLILEPHLTRELEKNLISFHLNNGAIAGGVVPDGEISVMSGDFGTLDISTRGKVGERHTVQYFGESTPSYHAANKLWKYPGQESNGVQNVIIQRLTYGAEGGPQRVADGFLVQIGTGEATKKNTFLQIEGRRIESDGKIIDIDTERPLSISSATKNLNKLAFDRAWKVEQEVYAPDYVGNTMKVMDIATLIDNISLKNVLKDSKGKVISSTSTKLAVGQLDLRQPRNQVGDVVITKLAKDPSSGQWHTDKNSGGISRMNYVDAIRAQDADFDFDKTFKYIAAPSKYWTQVNKNAGIYNESIAGNEKLRELFDPYVESSQMSQKIKSIIQDKYPKASFDFETTQAEVRKARGQFMKMHQTATYLSNILKKSRIAATFEKNKTAWEVRLSDRFDYHTTVNNIGNMAKRFIDMYVDLPSMESTRFGKLRQTQEQIWFGEYGMFDLYKTNKQGDMVKVPESQYPGGLNGKSTEFINVKRALLSRVIDPINKYLRYNKGVEEDPSGISIKADLKAYDNAYVNLMQNSLKVKDNSFIPKGINIKPMLEATNEYFVNSNAPYEVAMRGLHKTYQNSSPTRKGDWKDKNLTQVKEIENWIKEGAPQGESPAEFRNKLFDKTISEVVKDDARALEAIELGREVRKIKVEIQDRERFVKSIDRSEDLTLGGLKNRLGRAEELLSTIENSLSLRYGDKINNAPKTVPLGSNQKEGVWKNNNNQAVVIVDTKGKIKEVVEPGKRNVKYINKNTDKLIINGSRFKLADGNEQKGLEILHQAFANLPTVLDKNGNWIRVDKYELDQYIQKAFFDMKMEVDDIKKRTQNQTRVEKSDRALQIEEAIYNHLFNRGTQGNANNDMSDVYRKVIITRALVPEVLKTQFNIAHTTSGNATFDPIYYENPLSRNVMSLLVKIASGERKGDPQFAKDILNDIEVNKNAAYLKVNNVDANIDLIKTRLWSQPIRHESNGTLKHLTLDKSIYEMTRSKVEAERHHAKILVDVAQGKQIDSRLAYRATKIMEKATGLTQDSHWGSENYLTNPDGTLVNRGKTVVRINEIDKISGKSGLRDGLKETAEQKTLKLLRCLRGVK
tara:strand:+ start:2994 stop:12146 length:9153 start_codon:yes stop_codon:yes gene_type:complete